MERDRAAEVGWIQSRNRNKTLFWKDSALGRVEWFTSGKLLAHIKKPWTVAVAKTLLCRAFFETGLIFSPKVLDEFLETFQWYGQDDVHETSESLPYTVIDLVEAHGIRIVTGDSSHPNAIEVQRIRPQFVDRFMQTQRDNMELIRLNAQAMKQNSQVIQQNSQQIVEFNRFLKDLSQPKTPSKADRSMVV